MQAAAIYILAVITANLTATLLIPFPLFGAVSIGTLIFGITFTQRDRMHYRGRPFVYKVILLSALLTMAAMLAFQFALGPPLAAACQSHGLTWLAHGWSLLLGNGPRVYAASFTAIILAEALDTEVYHRLRQRSWFTRVAGSNAVSVPADSLLFNLIAFAGAAGFAPLLIAQMIFGEITVKYTVGAAYGLLRPRRETPPTPTPQRPAP